MKRIFRLALMSAAILAFSGVAGATTAGASGFAFGQYEANVYGTAWGPKVVFAGGSSFSCSGGASFVALVENASSTLTPYYANEDPSGCKRANLNTSVQWKMNGCKFIHHTGEAAAEAKYKGSLEIGPAGCGPMKVEEQSCTKLFAPQTSSGGMTYSTNGSTPKSITIGAQVILNYTVEKEGWECHPSYVTMSEEWQVKAYNVAGVPVAAEVIAPFGFSVVGEASESEALQPRFSVEENAISGDPLEGTSAAKQVLTLKGGRKVECDVVLHGEGSNTNQVALAPSFGNCSSTLAGITKPATVDANSCDYALGVSNAGPPYVGTLGVQCGGSDKIEVTVLEGGSTLCSYTIAPQSGLEGVGFANFGEGSGSGVTASLNVKTLSVTKVSGGSLLCGSSGNATYAGSSSLVGL